VYLHLIIGILSLCLSARLTVLLLLYLVLNLTFSLLPITIHQRLRFNLRLLVLYQYLIDVDNRASMLSTSLSVTAQHLKSCTQCRYYTASAWWRWRLLTVSGQTERQRDTERYRGRYGGSGRPEATTNDTDSGSTILPSSHSTSGTPLVNVTSL